MQLADAPETSSVRPLRSPLAVGAPAAMQEPLAPSRGSGKAAPCRLLASALAALVLAGLACRPGARGPMETIRLEASGSSVLLVGVDLPEGVLELALPSDLAAGDRISGTLRVAGSSSAGPRMARPDPPLADFLLEVDGDSFRLDQTQVHLRIDEGASQLKLSLRDGDGRVRAEGRVWVAPGDRLAAGAPGSGELPAYCSNGPVILPGPFDGDGTNTLVEIGGRTLPVWTESPRQATVVLREQPSGGATLRVEEGKGRRERTVQVLEVQVEPSRITATRGERVPCLLVVSGLAGLDANLRPVLTWTCTSDGADQPALSQGEVVRPGSAVDGLLVLRREFTAGAGGAFQLSAELQPAPLNR